MHCSIPLDLLDRLQKVLLKADKTFMTLKLLTRSYQTYNNYFVYVLIR
jgi:hypothetical protein